MKKIKLDKVVQKGGVLYQEPAAVHLQSAAANCPSRGLFTSKTIPTTTISKDTRAIGIWSDLEAVIDGGVIKKGYVKNGFINWTQGIGMLINFNKCN